MLEIILKILCILGWSFLVLLLLLLLLLLLILFFPISYQTKWLKHDTSMTIRAKVHWLFGLVNASFDYPKPGGLVIKLLWFTVFDSGRSNSGEKNAKKEKASTGSADHKPKEANSSGSSDTAASDSSSDSTQENARPSDTQEKSGSDSAENVNTEEHSQGLPGRLSAVFKKILYTIKQIYDKILNIWKHLDHYLTILQEEETKALFSDSLSRIRKILRSIRPRRIAGEIRFGTGSPDTTGYGMAVYGMLSPFLGQNLSVTPDFEEAVLEADLSVRGHLTIAVLVFHGLRVFLDRRLRLFIKKMKREVT